MWPTFFICGLANGQPDPDGCWSYIIKESNTDRGEEYLTPAADPELAFAAEPNTLYHIVGWLVFESYNNADEIGHKVRLACDEEVAALVCRDRSTVYAPYNATTGDTSQTFVVAQASDFGPSGSRYSEEQALDANELLLYSIDTLVMTGADGGNISVEWGARNASNIGQTRLRAGSYLVAHKVTGTFGYAVKPSDTSRLTDTEQADPDLQFATASGGTYLVRGRALVRARAGVGVSVGMTSGGTVSVGSGYLCTETPMRPNPSSYEWDEGAAEHGVVTALALMNGTCRPIAGYGDGSTYVNGQTYVDFSAAFTASENGTFSFVWGQDTLSGVDPAVVLAESALVWQRID